LLNISVSVSSSLKLTSLSFTGVTSPETFSEDCLYLNVFTPLNGSNLPVMVFFPGGRYEQGGAGVPLYDGAYLAQHGNMVVVTTNYRLGVLGFLVVDGLEGNFGMFT
jgi:carboxylesterase type B